MEFDNINRIDVSQKIINLVENGTNEKEIIKIMDNDNTIDTKLFGIFIKKNYFQCLDYILNQLDEYYYSDEYNEYLEENCEVDFDEWRSSDIMEDINDLLRYLIDLKPEQYIKVTNITNKYSFITDFINFDYHFTDDDSLKNYNPELYSYLLFKENNCII